MSTSKTIFKEGHIMKLFLTFITGLMLLTSTSNFAEDYAPESECSLKSIEVAFEKLFKTEYNGKANVLGEAWTDSFPFIGFNTIYKNSLAKKYEVSRARISVYGYIDKKNNIVGIEGYTNYKNDGLYNIYKRSNPGIIGYGTITNDCSQIVRYTANSYR